MEAHDLPRREHDWRLLAEADGVIAISDALRRRIVERFPDLQRRSWVEHDAVDLPCTETTSDERAELRRRVGHFSDGPFVLYTGRVNKEKGAGVLLDAAELLPNARFVLVGKVYNAAYEERARRLGNVTLTGFVSPAQVPSYLALADVFVLPSTPSLPYAAYTSPLKLFEYMAAKRPIVASGLASIREIVEHERNGLTFEPDDASGLATAVERLWKDTELGSRLVEQAWRDVQRYSWEKRALRIINHLEMVTDSKHDVGEPRSHSETG